MHGNNPKRTPDHADGQSLAIKSIFPTLQGEGPNAGQPAIFIRLGGCNLACDFCDTEFEDFTEMTLPAVLAAVAQAVQAEKLVVITGGEPLRQNIAPLCEALIAQGFQVQIETNGILWRPLPEKVHIICSPKAGNTTFYPLHPALASRITALKFLISTTHPHYHTVPHLPNVAKDIPVYVQPMDEHDATINAANTARALSLCQQEGYYLSLQTHKILGIA